VRLASFEGETIWEENIRVRVPANASHPVAHWPADRVKGASDRYLVTHSGEDRFPKNRHFFAAMKDLQRTPPEPDMSIIPAGRHELRVRLKAPVYAYFVHLEVPDEATSFSDNYFDLEPGEERTVIVTNNVRALSAENVKVGWR
jgi:beta-mannosidase